MRLLASVRTVASCVAVGLLLVACATAAATSDLSRARTVEAATCSHFGSAWAHSYDLEATKDGNPTRIVSACCKATKEPHVQGCFLVVGLEGVRERGCEFVDIGPSGLPVSEGVHETCPKTA